MLGGCTSKPLKEEKLVDTDISKLYKEYYGENFDQTYGENAMPSVTIQAPEGAEIESAFFTAADGISFYVIKGRYRVFVNVSENADSLTISEYTKRELENTVDLDKGEMVVDEEDGFVVGDAFGYYFFRFKIVDDKIFYFCSGEEEIPEEDALFMYSTVK